MTKKKRRFGVSVPRFDPEVDAFWIEDGDEEYAVVIDLAVMFEMQKMGLTGDDGNFKMDQETVSVMLGLGLKRYHPEVTDDLIDSWLNNPAAAISLVQGLGEYLQHVMESAGIESGEVQAPPGLTSGRSPRSKSASRTKR